jgi:hypothetical protein
VATGLRADRHGILSDREPDPVSGDWRRTSCRGRTAKALWNISTQSGLRSVVVNWAASHPAEEKNKAPATPEEKSKTRQAITTFSSHLTQAKLPTWAAVEKSDTAIRLLPGASLPSGNQGYANFGSIAQLLSSLEPDWTLELIARAEPGKDGWQTAQDRARLLMEAAENSLEGNPARLRLRIEVVKGPRMEWRLLPPEATAKPTSDTKAPKK